MPISAKISQLNEDVAAAPATPVGDNGTIALDQPRKVLLSLSPDDVQELQRDGNDLLVRTTDGQVIRIENFYGSDPTTTSQLYLTGDDQELIWADLAPSSGDGIIAADYLPQGEFGVFEPVAVAGEGADGASLTPLGWAAIGGGALAAGAISAGGGGGGGGGDDDGGTVPPDGGNGETDDTPPDAPTIDPSNGETISGEAEPGSTIIITDGDGNPIGETTTDDEGNWTFTPDQPLPDGTEIEVVAQDPAGNTSEPATGTIDATAPDAPTIDPSNGETISGEAEPGSTIIITDGDGNPIGETTTDDEGNWTFTPDEPLADGTEIEVVAQDPAGNTSEPATGTIDASAPDAPIVDPTDGTTLTGTAEPGSAITLTDGDGNAIGQTTTGDDGNWSFQPDAPLADGTEVNATATDAAGNVSEPGSVIVDGDLNDTTPPATPTIAGVNDDVAPQTGSVDREASTNDTTPTLSGRAEAGSTLTLYANGEAIGTTTANGQGEWTFTADDLDDSDYTFTATATDSAGNVSGVSDGYALTVDTSAPGSPTLDPSDGGILIGTAEPGSAITLTDGDGNAIGQTTTDANGNWSFRPDTPLADGTEVNATATDAAGNVSEPGTLTVDGDLNDTTPPATPTITMGNDDTAPQTGDLDSGDSTNDTTPTLSGQAEARSIVTIYSGETELGTTIANAAGEWSFTPEALDDGDYDFTATATDSAGNVSDASDPFTLTVDTQPPAAPVVNPTDGEILTGSAEPGSSVTLTNDQGDTIATIEADRNGNWSFAPETPLEDGSTFTAVARDAAGNASEPGNATVDADLEDNLPPSDPVIITSIDATEPVTGNVDNGGTTNDPNPTLQGTAEATNMVQVWADNTMLGETQADNFGNWSFRINARLLDGTTTFRALSTDPKGLVSEPSNTYALNVDTTPPDEPTATVADDGTAVTGNAEPGSTVTITDADGNEIGSITADPDDGSYRVPLDPALTNGESVTATATDAAGNESDPASATAPDLTAPDAPSVTVAEDGASVTGTAEPGSTVTVTDADGNEIGSVTADPDDGSYSVPLDPALTNGEGVTATATDAAGNESYPTNATAPDLTAPDAPTAILANDTGLNDGDGITSDATVNVGGIEDGAIWEYSIDGGDSWITGTGNSFELPEGDYDNGVVQVRQTDAAGNTSDLVTLGPVSVDQTAPVVNVDDLDAPINDPSPALSGAVSDPNATVTVTVNGDDYTAANNGDGTWTLAEGTVTLNEGDNSISAVATDAAGNTSEPVNETIELDTTADATPLAT
ncbi:Ig-like domain-containing protein, partial [Salinicola lusitanus]|uniref:Ig-like domain-containing protein n=1 Tax=Salinicola lusitanus TaxID=1949085 RepID=UPI001300335A